MKFILPLILRLKGAYLQYCFNRATKYPEENQKKLLIDILRKNRKTEYGCMYSFSSIHDAHQYRNTVPIVEYADIRPFVDKVKKGKENVLTSESPLMFALTSGTDASPKYIPVTRTGLNNTKRLTQQWLSRAISDRPLLLDSHILGMTGAAIEGYSEGGTPYGNASGMIYKTLSAVLQGTYVIPFWVSGVADYDLRYFVAARFAVEKPVSFIATPNPLTIVKLAETVSENGENIIRSIENGWLSETIRSETDYKNAGIPVEVKKSIKPNPERAASLRKIIVDGGTLKIADCWPDLTLIGCWLGGSCGFHVGALKKYFKNIPLRDIGYMASEGCMSIPFEDESPGGILALNNNYYEFIPESQIDLPNPDILGVTELEVGSYYKIILTNENGLYRYDINDVILVEGYYNKTPVISFARKSGNMGNITGEKLHLNQVIAAVDTMQSLLKISVNQFRIVPDLSSQRYELFVLSNSELSERLVRQEMIPLLDNSLCENNIEYAAKRKSGRLKPPLFHVMKPSWVREISRAHSQFEKRDVQYKWIQFSRMKIEEDYKYIKFSAGEGAQ